MPGNPLSDPNWAPDLADTIERVVAEVRDKTTQRAVKVVRALVFGIIIGVAAVTAFILVTILSVEAIQLVLGRITRLDPDSVVWLSYYVMAAFLLLIGAICMRLRRTPAAAA